MSGGETSYDVLEARFGQIGALGEAARVLTWDRSVNMPRKGAPGRAEQLASIRRVVHEKITDPAMPDLLDAAAEEVARDPWRGANLREMRRRWVHASALDADLIVAMARADSECEMAWRAAREADDYEAVKPYLRTVLELVRRAGEARAEALDCSLYDALMDVYEPGARTGRIDALFDDLAGFLPGFLDRVLQTQAGEAQPLPLEGPFGVEAQRSLGERLMVQLGFDFEAGRLDVSLHPFCSGVPGDIRVTTRYDTTDFTQSVMAVLHETGHALYNAGLPPEWRRQPVGSARGMAMHESQSLIVEMQACRSAEFIGFLAPLVRDAFEEAGPAWSADNLRRHYRRVARSLIRVDADEVTYPAHVILRYRLERELIGGGLSLGDLPGAWADGLENLLGIRPSDDASGCLQDIHWYSGTWGYFPTYALGALAAAQLFETALAARPGIPDALSRGDFTPLLGWLREAVHRKGSLPATTDDLLREATGAPLRTDSFRRHLERRYLSDR